MSSGDTGFNHPCQVRFISTADAGINRQIILSCTIVRLRPRPLAAVAVGGRMLLTVACTRSCRVGKVGKKGLK